MAPSGESSGSAVRQADRKFDAPSLEKEVRAFWGDHDVEGRARRDREGGPKFYLIDGPPYATGHIHLGTARNKALKDALLRYKRMRGFHVRDQPGFDMHGLPIEVKVEQELGFTTKKDIEDFGVDNFVTKCRDFALRFKDVMTDEFKEMGVSMDWAHPYMTITNDYIEGAWWALAKAHERGLLYESERVLTWCRRCETALAQAEVEYEDRKDPSIYVKLPLVGRPGESLVIWTTTPWTLPANMAVAAHPDLTYARVRVTGDEGSEVLVVAEALAEHVARTGRYTDFEVLETFPGRDMEGWWYVHPFAHDVPFHLQRDRGFKVVILGDHVTAERTGLVHTATGHGVEDYEVGQRYGLPVFSPVGPDGRYTAELGALRGLQVKGKEDVGEADAAVVKRLERHGLLLSKRLEKHSYGHCWRCKTPIVFRATDQWFVRVGDIKERMLAEVDRVDWTPDWAGSARQRDWVENARDWCVSRQRYWGIPVPVWRCGEGHTRVVGTRGDLAKEASGYEDGMDLHRPWIDGVTLPCRACGDTMRRVPDVLDVWFDSAVASWAELGYPSATDEFGKWFPADLIIEGLDQTRGWFYSQLGAGVAAMDRVPYERVLMHGWVNDESGRPMSKSLGNIIPPHDVIEKYGTDTLRFDLVSIGAPWDDLSFGWESARNTHRFLNILWNVHVFATQYMAMDGFSPSRSLADALADGGTLEDRWLVSRTEGLVADATAAFESLEVHRAARAVETYVLEDLSRWYVRLVRDRVWAEGDDAGKLACYHVLHHALTTVSRLLAPFAPFVTDAMHRDLRAGVDVHESVHLAEWPAPRDDLRDTDLEARMGLVRDVVEAAANARQKANMKLRWPVPRIVVSGDARVEAAVRDLEPLLLDQTNAKAVEYVGAAWERLDVVLQPVKGVIGPTFKDRAGEVLKALAEADPLKVREAVEDSGYTVADDLVVTRDMVTFETRIPEGVTGADLPRGSVYLDTEITDELKGEGYARDVARRIQELRKRLELPVEARVEVDLAAPPEFADLVGGHLREVADATRSDRVDLVDAPTGDVTETWDIEGEEITIGVTIAGGTRPRPKATTPKPKKPTATPDAVATFTNLPGVGAAKARALVEAGFTTLDDLAMASTEALQEADGVGPALAARVQKAAQAALDDAKPKAKKATSKRAQPQKRTATKKTPQAKKAAAKRTPKKKATKKPAAKKRKAPSRKKKDGGA